MYCTGNISLPLTCVSADIVVSGAVKADQNARIITRHGHRYLHRTAYPTRPRFVGFQQLSRTCRLRCQRNNSANRQPAFWPAWAQPINMRATAISYCAVRTVLITSSSKLTDAPVIFTPVYGLAACHYQGYPQH